MSLLEELSTEDLFFILEAENKKEIVKRFGAVTTREWLDTHNEYIYPKKADNKVTQSIFSAITDAPSYPLLVLWSIIGLITLKVVTLSLLTGGLGALMLVTGGLFYVATYREQKIAAKKNDKTFQLLALKNKCADLLTTQLQEKLGVEPEPDEEEENSALPAEPEAPEVKPDKKWLPKIKDAVKAALMVGTTLFGTYYFGTCAIIGAFGVTAVSTAMLGPIGLGAALAVTFAIGIYFGYKHYQENKANVAIKKQQKTIIAEIKDKTTKCNDLRNKIEQSYTMKAQLTLLQTRSAHVNPKPLKRISPKYKSRYSLQPSFLVSRHTAPQPNNSFKSRETSINPIRKKTH